MQTGVARKQPETGPDPEASFNKYEPGGSEALSGILKSFLLSGQIRVDISPLVSFQSANFLYAPQIVYINDDKSTRMRIRGLFASLSCLLFKSLIAPSHCAGHCPISNKCPSASNYV